MSPPVYISNCYWMKNNPRASDRRMRKLSCPAGSPSSGMGDVDHGARLIPNFSLLYMNYLHDFILNAEMPTTFKSLD
jgi:hypothetical protein